MRVHSWCIAALALAAPAASFDVNRPSSRKHHATPKIAKTSRVSPRKVVSEPESPREVKIKRSPSVGTMGTTRLLPTMATYSYSAYASILSKLANKSTNSGSRSGEEAEFILRQMQRNYQQAPADVSDSTTRDDRQPPDAYLYTLVITAYANSGHARAADHCERLLKEMDSMPHMEAEVITFTAILKAIAKSNPKQAGPRAEAMFQVMVDRGIQPNVYSYGVVIDAWSRTKAANAVDVAEQWLQRLEDAYLTNTDMGELSTVPYNNVLNAYAMQSLHRFKDSQELISRAEELLHRMEGDGQVKPDVISYTTVIQALAKTSSVTNPLAAEKSQSILDRMERLYQETNDERYRPDAVCYATVINAWGRCGGAQRAQDLLDHMETQYQSARKVMSPTDTVKSWDDCVLYTGVIDAYAREGNPVKAMSLLQRMYDRYQESGDVNMEPNARSYTAVIQAFANSDVPDRVQQAQNVLHTMLSLYEQGNPRLRPTVFSYTAVLQACCCTAESSVEDRDAAYDIAVNTLEDLCQSLHVPDGPNHVTYGTFIKAVASTGKPCDAVVREAFHQCCQQGMVHYTVLHQLKNAVSSATYEDLVLSQILKRAQKAADVVQLHHLPAKWSCHSESFQKDTSRRSQRTTV